MLFRLNMLLALFLVLSGLYLVKVSYESRHLYALIEHEHGIERGLEADRKRLEAERQAQATSLRVEKVAREKLAMRAAGAGATQYVNDAVASSANNAGAAR
jgi:cell division protein FtsL